MIKNKFKYIYFFVIIIGFISIFIGIRTNAKKTLKNNIYKSWVNHFIIQKKDDAYVKTNTAKNKVIVLSEGQGYGMLIAAKAGKQGQENQENFDRLYHYYLKMRIKNTQLMSWTQTLKENRPEHISKDNATDGDLYIAYALLEASKVWKHKENEYRQQAQGILKDILKYNYNPQLKVLTVGNWATKESSFYNIIRTSDIMPRQFEEFYNVTKDPVWLIIKKSMLTKLALASQQNKTGLLPDFLKITTKGVMVVAPREVNSLFDGDYYYNACRIPYQLAQSKDKKSRMITNKLLHFFITKTHIYSGYHLNGETLNNYQSSSFIAPILYASKQTPGYNKLVQRNKFIFMTDLSKQQYYDMALMTMVALDTL